jgi:hypothetical protein
VGSEAVEPLLGPGVDEDETRIGVVVDGGGGADIYEVPKKRGVVIICSLFECSIRR